MLILWTGIIISQNKWENIGAPNGGYVMKITEGPNKYLYAGTNSSGIFRSTDNGETWQSISTGIELYSNGIKSILATSNYIYCGTWGALYRSTNYGGNWEKITKIFNDAYIFDFELVGTNIFAATSKGLYQSSDNGVKWAYADTSLPKDEIDAIDIRNSMMVVVYNYSEGIGISTNNGKNWTLKPLQMSTFYDIIISDTTTFYAAGVDGFYKSTNLGENWQKLDKGINPLYSDGGQSIVEDKSGNIYCAQNEKVYKLNPDKLSWSVFNNGLSIRRASV